MEESETHLFKRSLLGLFPSNLIADRIYIENFVSVTIIQIPSFVRIVSVSINLAHQVADGLEGGFLHPEKGRDVNGGSSESVIERGEGSGGILPAIPPNGEESEMEQILPIK